MRTPCASIREFVPIGNQKEKTPHEVVLYPYAKTIQGYAARGEFLLYVPFLCNATLLILATQIPLCGMRTSLRFASGVRSHRKSKRKNTTRGGVFFFLVHLQGFEPGTHWLRVSCSTNWAKGASLLSVDNYSTTIPTFQAYFYKRAIFTMSKKVFDHKIRKKIMINKT